MNSARAIDSLSELLDQSVALFRGKALFLVRSDDRWSNVSYGTFACMVDDLRASLARLGVTRGDRVAVISSNSVQWAAIAYATYALGAALVPMYESQRDSDWLFIVRDSGAKVLFVSRPEIFAKVAGFSAAVPDLAHVLCIAGSFAKMLDDGRQLPLEAHEPGRSDEVAAILYTSGTTGEPKGVVLSHANILSNVLALKTIIRATIDRPEEHRALSFLPWAHAFGHTVELHTLIACGASLAIAESIDKVVDNIREVKPTVLVAVPIVFVRIQAGVEKLIADRSPGVRWLFRAGIEQARRKRELGPQSPAARLLSRAADSLIFSQIRARFGGQLRFAICGAAALPREAGEFAEAIGITVYEGYGLTECSPIVSANTPEARKLGSAGRPLPGVRIVIEKVDDAHPDTGEIIVHGPNVMRGYHARDAESRSVLTAEHGLRTGDLGYLDRDGFLFVTGRIKEQYKLANAKYVAPSPLEDRLRLSASIANVMVYGDNRPYNVALIVPDARAVQELAGADSSGQSLGALLEQPRVRQLFAREIERLSADFKGYEKIREFAFVPEPFCQENGTLTPSLKLKRREIIARWGHLLEDLYASPSRASAQSGHGGFSARAV